MSSEIIDERIKRFIEIMESEYNWVFDEEEAQDIISVLDRINNEFDGVR